MSELTQYIPNVTFQYEPSYFTAFIRGVGSTNLSLGGEQGVGFYLDGIYLDRGDAANINFYDVERIEILRGPQGTIYGRNTTGGAVNVITKRPSDKLEMKLGLLGGNYSKMKVDGTISGPIVADKIKARFSFSHSQHDGYLENVYIGADEYEEDYSGVRGALDFDPTSTVNIQIGVDYFKTDAHLLGEKLVALGGMPEGYAAAAGVSEATLIPGDFWERYTDQAQNREIEFYGGSLRATFQLPHDIVLTSLSGYREYDQHDTDADIDATPFDILMAELDFSTSTFTQELQLQGTGNRLTWLAGLYYLHSVNDWPKVRLNFDFIIPGLTMTRVAELTTDAWAGFANVSYAVTDKFSLEAGLRYSYEEKDLTEPYSQTTNIPFPPFGPLLIDFEDDWSATTWKLGANYQVTDDAFLYASVSRGFKSGSFSVLNPVGQMSLDPEYLTSYEVGLKSDWFDKRLRANGAVFYYDYTDQQVNTFFPPDITMVSNAAESSIIGAELELLARPIQALTLTSAISYLDAEYDDWVTVDGNGTPTDVSDNQMPYAPEWKLNIGAQYVVPLQKHGFLTFVGNLNWTDKMYFDHFENDAISEDSYLLVDALVRFETLEGHWSFELFGKNLGEEEYYTYKRDALGAVAGIVGAPRTFGLQVVYKY